MLLERTDIAYTMRRHVMRVKSTGFAFIFEHDRSNFIRINVFSQLQYNIPVVFPKDIFKNKKIDKFN